MELKELHKDVLKEAFNMGIGKAAAIISEMVGREVILSVPNLRLATIKQLILDVQTEFSSNVTGVYQSCSSPLKGTAILVYPHDSSLELIGTLLNSDSRPEKLGEVESEALKDFGNITLTSCLEELGTVLEGNIETGFPQIISGHVNEIMTLGGVIPQDSMSLSLSMDFSIKGLQTQGKINFTLDSINKELLTQQLDAYCKRLFGDV